MKEKEEERKWGFRKKGDNMGFRRQNWGRANVVPENTEKIVNMQEKFLTSLEKLEYDKDINFEIQSNVISDRNPLRIQDYPGFITNLIKTLCKSRHYTSVGNLLENVIVSRLKHKFKDLHPGQIDALLSQVFHFIRTMKQRETEVNAALRFLGHLTYENQIPSQQITYLLNLLSSEKILSNKFFTKLSQTPRLVVNLQTNILMRNPDGSQTSLTTIFNFVYLWFQFLCKNSNHFAGESFLKNMITCLRAISFVLQDYKSLDDLRATSLFINLHKFLFIGTDLAPKVFSKRTYKETANIPVIQLSDSQLSSGGEDHSQKDPYFRMRTFALHALQNIFKLNCKVIFNHYWYLLLPSFIIRQPQELFSKAKFSTKFEQALANEPTLVAMIMKEKALKIRISATVALSTLLQNSPISKWLGPLEKNNEGKVIIKYDKPLTTSSTAITPLSQTLGLIIRFMHYILIFLIQRERAHLDFLYREHGQITDFTAFHLISQLVKLAGTLVSVTPYVKMCEGLLSSLLVPHISDLLFNYDDEFLKAAAIHCFMQAFGVVKGVRQEMLETLGLQRDKQIEHVDIVGYILMQCPPQDSKMRPSKGPLALERGSMLTRFAKNYGTEMLNFWKQLRVLFEAALAGRGFGFGAAQDKKKLQYYFLKTIEEWLRQQRQSFESKNKGRPALQDEEEEFHESDHPLDVFSLPCFSDYFIQIVRRHFDESGMRTPIEHQSIVLNCLTYLGTPEWNQMPDELLHIIVQSCLDSSEKAQMLYISAIKLLGCMACLPLFTTRQGFLPTLIEKITSAKLTEQNTNVFIRLSWTMANTCAMLKEEESSRNISIKHYVSLFEAALSYVKSQKEKSSANGIRSLGFLLRNGPLPELESSLDLISVLQCLYQSLQAKQAKIAWNACVALSNAIQNPNLTPKMKQELYSVQNISELGKIIEERENFKVRIHATQTLRQINNMEHFGEGGKLLLQLWERALRGIQNIEKVVVEFFSERKYIQTLERNMIELMHHFAFMVKKELDVGKPLALSDFLANNAKSLVQFFSFYLQKSLKITESIYEKVSKEEKPEEENKEEKKESTNPEEVKKPEIEDYNPLTLQTVKQIQEICGVITGFIEKNEEHDVSFAIFEKFDSIAKATSLQTLRELEVLAVTVEHSFDQSLL